MSNTSLQRNLFGLTVLKNSHPDIRKIRTETGYPTIHGNKFWKSTILLMDYLNEFPPEKGVRILEVGCGWGLGGIYCASKFSANIVSLDADDTVFPYLEHHAAINGVDVKTWKCRYEGVRKRDLEGFDLLIAADVCFWDSMSKPLFNLVRRATQSDVRVVMADPGRPPFREMAERCVDKLHAHLEDWFVPHPNNASGIILDTEVDS